MVEAKKQLIVVVQKTLHGVPVVFFTVSTVFPKYWSSLCEMVCATIFLFCPRFERSYCVVFSEHVVQLLRTSTWPPQSYMVNDWTSTRGRGFPFSMSILSGGECSKGT